MLAGDGDCCVPSCPHYLHNKCAELLAVGTCPLCRSAFNMFSVPIDRDCLSSKHPGEVLAALSWLSGGNPSRPPSNRVAVGMLAALLPIPVDSLRQAVDECCSSAGSLDESGLTTLLETLNIHPTYTFTTHFSRYVRRLLLRLVGAIGTSIPFALAGLAIAVLIGCIRSIPVDSSCYRRIFSHNIIVEIVVWIMYGIYHGIQNTDIVFDIYVLMICAACGLGLGLRLGFEVADPDLHGEHGFWRVFKAGLFGEYYGQKRGGAVSANVDRVDLFERAQA